MGSTSLPEALALSNGECPVGSPAGRVGIVAAFGSDHDGARLAEQIVVREAATRRFDGR
jgi:hypothetical protein